MTFEQLLKKLSPILKRIVFRLNVRGRYFNDDDLYQEAVVYLWRQYQVKALEDKTDSYILQGCYFFLKNYLRTHKNKAVVTSIEATCHEEGSLCNESIFFTDERSELFRDHLHSAMLAETIMNNGLTSREKLLLSFCADGLTTRQAGERLGVSHVRVVKMLRAIEKKCLKYLDCEKTSYQ
ncbi:MAG: sigma-70 family RNA polymerase sigma factor [Candidatus Omnitrophica bacterium]|nr:sigma-70 family RNA polymerase sigma factor [Candidatus Omnitrophota bacterium]